MDATKLPEGNGRLFTKVEVPTEKDELDLESVPLAAGLLEWLRFPLLDDNAAVDARNDSCVLLPVLSKFVDEEVDGPPLLCLIDWELLIFFCGLMGFSKTRK